eukprot:m.915503 g.915503  ORF g.915503 m.915503 type:complete len:63 (-) comp23732_c0_seq73:1397-1585(-)
MPSQTLGSAAFGEKVRDPVAQQQYEDESPAKTPRMSLPRFDAAPTPAFALGTVEMLAVPDRT